MVGTNSSSASGKNGRDKKSKKALLPLAASLAAAGLYAVTYSHASSNLENGRWLSSLRSGNSDEGGYNGDSRHPNFGSEETLEKYAALMETFRPRPEDLPEGTKLADFKPIPLPPFSQTEAVSVRGERPVALNDLRPGIKYTWQDHYDAVTEAGHEWCPLLRDIYSCHGPEYSEALLRTPPFDVERFGLKNLPPGSKVLLHGNCMTWEQILPSICALGTDGYGYRLDLNSNTFLVFSGRNVEDPNTIAILTVSNHREYAWGEQATPERLAETLSSRHPWFVPTHVVTGGVNELGKCNEHASAFREAWPDAKVVTRCDQGRLMGRNCGSDNHKCQRDVGLHQCVPGPGSVVAGQTLVHDLMQARDWEEHTAKAAEAAAEEAEKAEAEAAEEAVAAVEEKEEFQTPMAATE